MTHPLYTAAREADDNLTAIIKAHTGRDRWTLKVSDYLIPEVNLALQAKYAADDAWLAVIRSDSERRQSRRRDLLDAR